MIKVIIRYIALIAEEDKEARIAFPREKHDLRIYRNGIDEGSASKAFFRVRHSNGNKAAVRGVRGLPMDPRVLSIRNLCGGPDYSLRPTADLLKEGLAQTVLTIPTGKFRAKWPHTMSAYKFDHWDVGGGRKQELTDQVECRIKPESALFYSLELMEQDGEVDRIKKVIPLSDGDEILFSNRDTVVSEFTNDGSDRVEIKDVDSLYKLVDPPPKNRPRPSAPFRPEAAGKAVVGANGLLDVLSGGDLPLCPVGQP